MHLSEEMGGATAELNRLQIVRRASADVIEKEIEKIFDRAAARLQHEAKALTDKQERGVSLETWTRRLDDVKSELRGLNAPQDARQWIGANWPDIVAIEGDRLVVDAARRLFFVEMISDKFKEEIADVFSWITALACKLGGDEGLAVLDKLSGRYSEQKEGIEQMACSWCREEACSNNCLVRHTLRDELVEKVMKM